MNDLLRCVCLQTRCVAGGSRMVWSRTLLDQSGEYSRVVVKFCASPIQENNPFIDVCQKWVTLQPKILSLYCS